MLNLSSNDIGPKMEIYPDLIFQLSAEGLEIDLSHNNLQEMSYSQAFKYLRKIRPTERKPATVDISDNPFICDCRNINLALQMRKELPVMANKTTWLSFRPGASCGGPEKTLLAEIPLKDMTCNFPSSFLNDKCPQGCNCTYTPYQSSAYSKGHISVNCSGNFGNSLPAFVPPSISNGEIDDEITLDLSRNRINSTSALRQAISSYDNITSLILSHNDLEAVVLQELPRNLTHLALDHNQLKTLDVKTLLSSATHLKDVWIGKNPYVCSCESSRLFRFVTRNPTLVKDSNQVSLDCHPFPMPFSDIHDAKEFCTEFLDLATAIALPVSLVSILILTMAIVFLVKRQTIFIWIYSKPFLRSLFFSAEDDMDKEFDVFISYSHVDEDFVETQMVPTLENKDSEYSYRCLVHVRDFVVGRAINDQIIEAVDKSNRTLIVLSESFIQSDWAVQE